MEYSCELNSVLKTVKLYVSWIWPVGQGLPMPVTEVTNRVPALLLQGNLTDAYILTNAASLFCCA